MPIVALLLGFVLVLLIILCWEQRGVEERETMVLQDSFFVLVGSALDGYSFREQTVEKAIQKVELYIALCSLESVLDEEEIFVLYRVHRYAHADYADPIRSFCDHPDCSNATKCRSIG